MSEFGILATAAAGMDAQRYALDVAARNVAAAQVADPTHPFERLVPQFVFGPSGVARPGDDEAADTADGAPDASSIGEAADPDDGVADDTSGAGDDGAGLIRATGTRTQPGVEVDAVTEMVAVLNAQRAYEANASVFDAGKRLAERTIDMGRL